MKIVITSDHAGFALKKQLNGYLWKQGYEVYDIGADNPEPSDYPDFAHSLAELIEKKEYTFGISICGSGNGINMTANKHQGIRSAICWNEEIATLARKHNNANICALPGRFISYEEAVVIVRAFLNTDFEGGRHEKRIKKIPIR